MKVLGDGYTGKATKFVPGYKIMGPNSNTFANQLISKCGGVVDWPLGAFGEDKPY